MIIIKQENDVFVHLMHDESSVFLPTSAISQGKHYSHTTLLCPDTPQTLALHHLRYATILTKGRNQFVGRAVLNKEH
jgi:hypothetical protein